MSPRARSHGARRGGRASISWPPGVIRITPDHLRWVCDPALVARAVTQEEKAAKKEQRGLESRVPDEVERRRLHKRARLGDRPPVALDELVGQKRAVEAIASGLGTEAPGFHVFVCGPRGSGREALVRAALAQHLPPLPRPRDRVYVASFQHPDRPCLLTLPRGKGRHFKRDLDDMLAALRRAIPAALNHETHVTKCERLRRRSDNNAIRVIDDLAAELRGQGLIVMQIPEGFGTPDLRIEVGGGDPLPLHVLERRLANQELPGVRELRRRIKAYPSALGQLEDAASEARSIARKGTMSMRRLDARVARSIAQGFADDLAKAFPTQPVRRWLDELLEEVGEKVELFCDPGPPPQDRDGEGRREQDGLAPFRANLFVNAMERPVPPLLFEPNPSYQNLFGSLESDDSLPGHARLRSGSLLQANGGVIVVDADELFRDLDAWRALKRSVKSGWLEVQKTGSSNAGSLRPEPIRTAFKMVAIGSEELYHSMVAYDPDFTAVFKVKVQVEETIPRSKSTVHDMSRATLRVARRAGLQQPNAGALARLIEHSARLAGRNDRLVPAFSDLLDILQEADRIATARSRAKSIAREDVEAALTQRRRRHDLGERQAQELLDDGIMLLECTGSRVGVVNALVVYDDGVVSFCRPTRVTAAVGLGRRGVVDIEREAHFSGNTHHKGLAIAAGLLRERYAQDKPLCLTGTVCFEQSYAPVNGDSASMAEVLALLSALADLPLDQGWGVTGSIDQKGDVQAIGDVNAKVEGHFAACLAQGLTGRQGVVIPESNMRDLMLEPKVVEAVAKGRFHVAAVRSMDDALELLTGVMAGSRPSPLKPYSPATVNGRVDARLRAYADAAREFDRREQVD